MPKQTRPANRMERGEYLSRASEFALCGVDLPQSNLNPTAVKLIREAASMRETLKKTIADKYSNAAIAKKWGVSTRAIEKVLAYKTWRHVK